MDDRWFTIVTFVCFCLTYEVSMSLGDWTHLPNNGILFIGIK